MDPSIELQKQVKDNAEDLRAYLSDLASWAGAMNNQSAEIKNRSRCSIPPIRNHNKKRESNDKAGSIADSKVSKRFSIDCDDRKNFDVDKASDKLDKHGAGVDEDLMIQDEAQYEKERGNRFVKRENWDGAIVCYSKAIKLYPKDATFYANRALCFLKKREFHSVDADCTAALQLQPDYVKALQRRSAARRELNQLEDALKDLDKALILEPDNTALKADLALVKHKLTLKVDAKPKITQKKEQLKWVPPNEAGSSTSTTPPSKDKIPPKSSIDLPPAPVVIEPAKKHQKIGHVSKEDVETKDEAKVKPIKNVCAEPPKVPETTSSIKWFNKEGLSEVQPIVKPPHRRSKEPLQRLPVRECPNYNLDADIRTALKEIALVKEESSKLHKSIDNPEVVVESNNAKNTRCQPELNVNEADLPVPSTSVQFLATWKLIHENSQLCFKFLKKISADDLHKIFQDCLESDTLSGIIRTLDGEFTKENVPVYDYLLGLSKVRRFSMLAMFLSGADKKGLQKLFDYCLTKEGRSEETVNNLKKIYEM